MNMGADVNIFEQYQDQAVCRGILERLQAEATRRVRFMEVCGTHTVALFHSGIRSLLPENLVHLSGPGCPVCVTHERDIASFLKLAKRPDVILATFGDLMRIPGPEGKSLKSAQAEGSAVKIVYSPIDALELAKKHPEQKVVFLGVGFETTAPAVAATLTMALTNDIKNFFVYSCHKLVPPVLRLLAADEELDLDAFMLPGHACAVTGLPPFEFLAREYKRPAVVAGFDPFDILRALLVLTRMVVGSEAGIKNEYERVVAHDGNTRAKAVMAEVFEESRAHWRGIGPVENSGLVLRGAYRRFDALSLIGGEPVECPPLSGCRCGEVLKGKITPNRCGLFRTKCTPASPVGPCMVSSEGSCAAYFRYGFD